MLSLKCGNARGWLRATDARRSLQGTLLFQLGSSGGCHWQRHC